MTNHPNRSRKQAEQSKYAAIGILKSSNGRTGVSYAVLERLDDGRYCTYLKHHDVGGETRVAYHRELAEAERRYDALFVRLG